MGLLRKKLIYLLEGNKNYESRTIVKFRKNKLLNKIIYHILLRKGIDMPAEVKLGKDVKFPHNSVGTVIHNNTIIEDNVRIYQNVTLGRADIHKPMEESQMKGIHIKRGAIICAGAKVLCKKGVLEVGENTIIAANAVLLQSTGNNEIFWGVCLLEKSEILINSNN